MERKRILVADDDPDILEVLCLILENEGFEVTPSSDGKNLENEHPDLFLLDIDLSGVNGYSICKRLKKEEKTKNIPVIMISANKNIKQVSSDCGADAYIPKPFHINELIRSVQFQLDKQWSF